jgi:hypothetical protein
MDSSRPFFQQLSARFSRILLLSFLLIGGVTALLVIRDNQLTQLAGKSLPLIVKQSERQKQILTTYLTLEKLTKRTNAKKLTQDYQQAQQQINMIATLVPNKKALLDLMFIGHKEFAGVIDKLSKNHDRNNQLKQSTLIQLQLLKDQLTTDINSKRDQTNQLLTQINADKFTDKVTAVRAKAYSQLLTELSRLQQLQQSIIRALLIFQQLNLHTAIVDFDQISAELRQVLAFFVTEVTSKQIEPSVLTAQLTTLDQLLFSQQNTVAKWRSQLRLSRLYVTFIEQQQQKLQQLVNEYSLPESVLVTNKILLSDYMPEQAKHWLLQQQITIGHQQLQWAIIAIIVLLFLLLYTMIVRAKRKIKNYGIESIQLFKNFIENASEADENKYDLAQLNSAENKKIAELIQKALTNITQPKHSESEYQQRVEEQQILVSKTNQQLDEIKQLQVSITQLTLTNSEQNQQQQHHDSAMNEKLSNMVVRTMLQSQSVSIGSGVTSLQVYRQLTRIFDWCRQSKIRDEFLSATQSITLSDVALHHEIEALLLNVIFDAHFQRNQIFYQQDEHLLVQAKLDIRLFNRLFSGVCRLLLADLFKASLQISTTVEDKNEGQQIVRFDFLVTTSKKISQLPESIERLLSVDKVNNVAAISAENEMVSYLLLLLDALNVSDKNAQLQENGYQFSFTLPMAFADVNHDSVVKKIDLQQANMVLISNDDNTCNAVKAAVLAGNGSLETLTKFESLPLQLSAKHLLEKKVDIIILGGDCYLSSLENIQQHIASLAKSIQPKLFVMQTFFNAPLHRHGLFEQAANPLQNAKLQQALATLLVSENSDNSVLNAETFVEHQYLATQVEVLFAVHDPSKHQPLLRMLLWLGLQVQVVCQSQAMLKFWRSGRYLLLFTDFDSSPCIEMSAGKGVRRAVFSFNDNNFSTAENQTLAGQWLFATVPPLNRVDELVALLLPWLKAKSVHVAIDKVVADKPYEVAKTSKKENEKESETEQRIIAQAHQASEKLGRVLSALDLTPSADSHPFQVINLAQYAKHQGSVELAVVMLDDYLADISQLMNNLSQTLNQQNYSQGVSLLTDIIKTSSILAAQDFTEVGQQLMVALNQQKMDEDNTQLMKLFSDLKQQQLLLTQFCEAI